MEVWNKELHDKKVEAQELRREISEMNGTWRTRMVDKGVGALPRPQVYSVPVQTDAATVGVGIAVPKFVFDAKTWAERAAMGVPGSESSDMSPPPPVGVPKIVMRDVSSTTGGGVKGRKWGPEVTNARSLVIYEVS